MPDLPLLSQTGVTIQNNTTGQVDYLKYQGSTLTASMLKDYSLGADWKIVAFDLGANNLPGLVAQNENSASPLFHFVDFLTLDANANMIGSQLSNVAVPHIFGLSEAISILPLEVFGSQLPNGQLDFLQFNVPTGQLVGSDLVATPVPTAQAIFGWANFGLPPAWEGSGGGLNGDVVLTQLPNGQSDMIGFSGSFAGRDLAVITSFLVPTTAPPIGEANPNIGFASNQNLADPPGPLGNLAPQGLEVVAQTASGQLDLVWYDTGRDDPVASNLGIRYAENPLDSFPGWHVVQGGPVNHTDLFPIV
jgi:hypothetical protein